ncbi:bifunctional sugar-1-phosphate nucleotidylyltransferase/acetyltransferase [Halobacterium sp. KA-6]|uniref:bifunctional sugar-1-phosphate nucleotidylyltransferase/acetyltransferase n=1 Tax=Halobacterium sp. KA-6 TaxID=2896368 RepID=UPI001E627BF6|nr:bifunctional sugar-1-phosphate nucleotidylyltransferase/acetyltransferase [Halobacterium sp. KA-6]MCD2204870.1 NTP transferase domain-containing protein [Halobacterium sp. KA-6]
MQAIVVAAGQGTRMGPLTDGRPKPLLPVAGKPILEHVLDVAAPYVDSYVVIVGYEGDQIRDRVDETYEGLPVEYVEQAEQLGTAHAVGKAEPYVDEDVLVLNGDVYVTAALVEKLAAQSGTAMAVMPVENPSAYGVVELDGDQVTSVVEKPTDPPTNLANLGLYRFTPQIFENIKRTELSERGEYELTDALEMALDDGVTAVEYDGPWLDIGRPWELLEANSYLLDDLDRDIQGEVEAGATLKGSVVVEAGARVRDGAYIEGPVRIQAGADVGPNAYVRGSTVIGPDVRVGNAVEIKNSILLAGTAVSHHAYVGDSVLGADVNFGAGTKVANLRHDEDTVHVQVKGEMVDTGRRKLGVVVGDDTKTGINTSLNAGVTLGTGTLTSLGERVTTDKNRGDH